VENKAVADDQVKKVIEQQKNVIPENSSVNIVPQNAAVEIPQQKQFTSTSSIIAAPTQRMQTAMFAKPVLPSSYGNVLHDSFQDSFNQEFSIFGSNKQAVTQNG